MPQPTDSMLCPTLFTNGFEMMYLAGTALIILLIIICAYRVCIHLNKKRF